MKKNIAVVFIGMEARGIQMEMQNIIAGQMTGMKIQGNILPEDEETSIIGNVGVVLIGIK